MSYKLPQYLFNKNQIYQILQRNRRVNLKIILAHLIAHIYLDIDWFDLVEKK
jgi:hypothetical protein